MNDPLAHLLRNAHPELIYAFLTRQHAPGLRLSGTPRQRKETVTKYLTTLRSQNDAKAAEIEFQARRIEALNRSQYDRHFRNYIRAESLEQTSEYSQRNKSLWLWFRNPEGFDDFEREVSLDHLQSLRNRRTRFQTLADRRLSVTPFDIDRFETSLKDIYRRHDGSGKFITSYPPQNNAAPAAEFAFSLSQPPRHLETYGDDGETEDELIRGITWGHISYDEVSGKLHVSSTRGGKDVRDQIAETFARVLLDVQTPPSVVPEDRVNLHPVLRFPEMPPLPNQDKARTKRVGIRLQHKSILFGSRIEISNKAGLPVNTLSQLYGTKAASANILSVNFKITGYIPKGSQKPVTVTLTLHIDGSLSFGGTPVDRQVLETEIRSAWLGAA